ncbi:MAG: hypothetical protein QM771_06130 [Nitrospira sp.]
MSCPVFVLLFLVQASLVMAGDLALDNPRSMRFPTVEFNPPDAERLVLANGMVVYLLEDHELPLVTINATLKTGSWLDPADKVGLAGMTGAAMRTGGSAGECHRTRSMKSWNSWRPPFPSASARSPDLPPLMC